MLLNTNSCYQALVSHDRRFDGAFFVGVSSTGVYCRTVCTARTPSAKNCRFFASAAAAENAGYRPCLRCRPELAPGSARVDALNRAAGVVAKLIEAGALNEMSVSELAGVLGLSERHLRRIVESAFGVSPVALAQTQRLLLAKRLLCDSNLSITEVAFASGFASLRRFNALLKERYGLSPSQLRAGNQQVHLQDTIRCQLNYRPPFDWKSLLNYFGPRSINGVETVAGDCYSRAVRIGKEKGWLTVQNDTDRNALFVDVSTSLAPVLMPLLSQLKRMFDLDCEPQLILERLGSLAESHPGLRLPGAFDGFETSLRAVLGQQVSVKAASTLMNRLCRQYGEPVNTGQPGLELLSPTAEKLADLEADKLIELGVTGARARTIITLARAVAAGTISLALPIDPETRIAEFMELPGIGVWTAHYLAMRVLHWPDAFPASDLGIRKALGVNNERKILSMAEGWRPWRSYAAIHLWKSLEV
jgi:AraC family transcriptional regulator, regulatory protein of adaptative response / DNA-3-methyladenine glycosylase II